MLKYSAGTDTLWIKHLSKEVFKRRNTNYWAYNLNPRQQQSPFPQSLAQHPHLMWMHKPPETHTSECWSNPEMFSTQSHSFGPRNWVNYCKPFEKLVIWQLPYSFECTLITAHILNPSWSVLGEKHRARSGSSAQQPHDAHGGQCNPTASLDLSEPAAQER